jgi:hypothetical protein
LRDFIGNVRDRLVDGGFLAEAELARDVAALERHLADPEALVVSHLFFRVSGASRLVIEKDAFHADWDYVIRSRAKER